MVFRRIAFFAALVLVSLSAGGCTLRVRGVDAGRRLSQEMIASVARDDTMASVLERLGPPDEYQWEPSFEVLEYRYGSQWGTSLSFSAFFRAIPGLGTVIGATRGSLGFFSPDRPRGAQVGGEDPITLLLPFGLEAASGNFQGGVNEQRLLDLDNRRLRWTTLRVIVDSASRRVVQWSVHDARTGDGNWFRAAFLQE